MEPESSVIVAGLVSLSVALLVCTFGNAVLPRVRRWNLTREMDVYAERRHGVHGRVRVVNGGYWTISNAVAYLTLDAKAEDVLSPPTGKGAFIRPGEEFTAIKDMQLCWSVRPNPMKVDIYAKEHQPLSVCAFAEDHIVIPSEEGWSSARVFLRRRRYEGNLKIVSADTDGRCFGITIDPDQQEMPVTIAPAPMRRPPP